MFQLWKLIFLCSLLTGTLGSLLEDVGSDLDVLDDLEPIAEKEIQSIDNALGDVQSVAEDGLQKLKLELQDLQDSKIWQEIQEKSQEAEKLLGNGLSSLVSDIKSLGLQIRSLRIRDLNAQLTSDGQAINLRFPATADVSFALPIVGNTVSLQASLDTLTTVSVSTDPQTDLPVVTLGKCSSDPASIQLSLLNNHSALINQVASSLSSLLTKAVSFIVQREMSPSFLGILNQAWWEASLCPLISFFLNTVEANVFQNIIHELEEGIHVPS